METLLKEGSPVENGEASVGWQRLGEVQKREAVWPESPWDLGGLSDAQPLSAASMTSEASWNVLGLRLDSQRIMSAMCQMLGRTPAYKREINLDPEGHKSGQLASMQAAMTDR